MIAEPVFAKTERGYLKSEGVSEAVVVAMHRQFFECGVSAIRGHLMFALADDEYAAANTWLTQAGLLSDIQESAAAFTRGTEVTLEQAFDAEVP